MPTLAGIEEIFKEARDLVTADVEALNKAVEIALGSGREAFNATMKVVDDLVALNKRSAEEVSQTAKTVATESKLVALAITLLAAVVALALGIVPFAQHRRSAEEGGRQPWRNGEGPSR